MSDEGNRFTEPNAVADPPEDQPGTSSNRNISDQPVVRRRLMYNETDKVDVVSEILQKMNNYQMCKCVMHKYLLCMHREM